MNVENKSNELTVKSNTDRIIGYDFARSFAIIVAFIIHVSQWFGHVPMLVEQSYNYKDYNHGFWGLILVAPAHLIMSLLGFASAVLLTRKYKPPYDAHFFLGRFTRIYISLFLCLLFSSVFLTVLGKNAITHHTIYHFLGLSAFFDLFGVDNNSPLGGGLWFISAILIMYLLLPFLAMLFTHRNSFIHLLILVSFFTFLYYTMYGVVLIWDVAISFSVGVYLSLNGKIQKFEGPRYIRFSIIFAPLLLAIATLANTGILPYKTHGILYPFYPPVFIPLFFVISNKLEKWKFAKPFIAMVLWFSGISYEFYILHFYFIRSNFERLFPYIDNEILHILISFIIICGISYLIARLSSVIRQSIMSYFFGRKVEPSVSFSSREIQTQGTKT